MRAPHKLLSCLFACGLLAGLAAGQAGRRPDAASTMRERFVSLNLYASRADGSDTPVTAKDVALYDAGMEQAIQSFTPDPSPAHIVLLVDNSLGLRADVEKLQQATREFAYEIYEGDQVMVIGYDQNAEIISDWTDDAKKIEQALPTFRKRGEPHLFDALAAVLNDALVPFSARTRKRAVVLVADGLDRGSKSHFDDILRTLQAQDITVYALQIPDRTGGALRRDRLKPAQVIQKLVEGTGGRVLSVNEPREAAKSVCDELRRHRYVLSYTPASVPFFGTRRLLVLPNEGVNVRHKLAHPGQ
ncbi:MAG: VWA domain-containing protein [Acidobacteria bacterium]|nr:VWA domain-containing protein [Acidobacteriota bacterium]